jgi:hypothetical protein
MAVSADQDGGPQDRIVHYQTGGIHFLMSRNGDIYWASFNNGTTEQINPIDGTPRPVPDPAVKTKRYKVPPQLRETAIISYSAGNFSGTMRLAAGSYYSRGLDAPFSFNWTKTHGIFRGSVMVDGVSVFRYWVIEISANGVFSAPITPGTWSVSAYLQTSTSVLDLNWAFANKPPTLGIKRLLLPGDMSPVYASGSPWFSNHGWAFSYTGVEAQNVVKRFVTNHFKCSRWKLAFTMGSATPPALPPLVAMLTSVETDAIATFYQATGVWVPQTTSGTSSGTSTWSRAAHGSFSDYPTQDAPVFVYYDGETEIVVRWSFSKTDIPGDSGYPVWLDYGSLWTGFSGTVFNGSIYANWFRTEVSGVTKTLVKPAFIIVTGFYCSKFNHVKETRGTEERLIFGQLFEMGPYTWTQSVSWAGGCSGLIETTTDLQEADRGFNTTSDDKWEPSSLVLFMEREACLGVRKEFTDHLQILQYRTSGYPELGESESAEYTSDHSLSVQLSGPCEFEDIEVPGEVFLAGRATSDLRVAIATPRRVSPPDEILSESHIRQGKAFLCLGSSTAEATFSYSDTGDFETAVASNPNLGNFVLFSDSASSNVRAMHGNLYYPDPNLTPTDQKTNAVYLLDNVEVLVGGFAKDAAARPISFVGKA